MASMVNGNSLCTLRAISRSESICSTRKALRRSRRLTVKKNVPPVARLRQYWSIWGCYPGIRFAPSGLRELSPNVSPISRAIGSDLPLCFVPDQPLHCPVVAHRNPLRRQSRQRRQRSVRTHLCLRRGPACASKGYRAGAVSLRRRGAGLLPDGRPLPPRAAHPASQSFVANASNQYAVTGATLITPT
jgi:hypothetical protein